MIDFKSQRFFSKDDVVLEVSEETFELDTSVHGKVDERLKNRMSKLSFTPVGVWNAGQLAVLYPYFGTNVGTSVFGTDSTCVVTSITDGVTLTMKAAAVTKMPDLNLSAVNTVFGSVEITGIGSDDTAWSVSESLIDYTTGGSYSDTSFDESLIKTVPYALAWGGTSPWSAFQTKDGTQVTFNLSLQPLETDNDGLVDMTFAKLDVVARLVPLHETALTENDILDALKIQGTGVGRGKSLGRRTNTNDLVIQGATTGDPKVTIYNAAMRKSTFRYGAQVPRLGEIEFVATRKFTAGVSNNLAAVAVV